MIPGKKRVLGVGGRHDPHVPGSVSDFSHEMSRGKPIFVARKFLDVLDHPPGK